MVVGVLVGAQETKVRPAVVVASTTYLTERPDVLVGILTTKMSRPLGTTDYRVVDWRAAGLRTESLFRAYILTTHRSELTVIGHLSSRDWESVKARVRAAFSIEMRRPSGLPDPPGTLHGDAKPTGSTRRTDSSHGIRYSRYPRMSGEDPVFKTHCCQQAVALC